MILYESNAEAFCSAADDNRIVGAIERAFIERLGHTVSPSEKDAWGNSLLRMSAAVRRAELPGDCGVLIEYSLPSTSRRIDFLIAGRDDFARKNVVIVELKQWTSAEATDLENTVRTFLGGGLREVAHPAYQAQSYRRFLCDMNEAVTKYELVPSSCAYLHNFERRRPEPLLDERYRALTDDTPVFFSGDAKTLQGYLRERVGRGGGMEILEELESGEIRPTRRLIDEVTALWKGNPVFTLLDEQQVAFATIMKAALAHRRTVVIVKGGPGTGKSVVAMNAFVRLLQCGKNVRFVAPNASFKESLIEALARGNAERRGRLKALFVGSGGFVEKPEVLYDVLVTDEAHRLKRKGTYQYRGDGQVEDIVKSARVSIFFIDDAQRIRPDDEGSVRLIRSMAQKYRCELHEVALSAQFRCAGAAGFVNWIDTVLQIRDTGNAEGWDRGAFEFFVADSPQQIEAWLDEKRAQGRTARLTAGYAWPWTGEKEGNPDAQVCDVKIPEHGWERPWNSRRNTYRWAFDETMRDQVGCVHTSQGLEFDYAGVIIGPDLKFDPERHELWADKTHYFDRAGKKGIANDPEKLTALIKNIYRVLLSRGMKGCAVYCCDEALQAHFRERLAKAS
jgi:DUF2075 family protein